MHRGTVSTEKQYAQYIMDNRKTEEETRRLKAHSFKGYVTLNWDVAASTLFT